MKLDKIQIKNYRNLDGLGLAFDPVITFMVGETNLGKSNFLSLLNTLFNRRSFFESDFTNPNQSIEAVLRIKLHDIEKGLFDDLFDPDESDFINIKAVQESIDDDLHFFHVESENNIPARSVRALNYIYYDSLRNPGSELTFDRNRGVGRFLNHIFKKYLEEGGIEEIDFLDREGLQLLVNFINDRLAKIKSFQDFSIMANLEEDTRNLLARIVTLKDDKDFNLQNSGYGVQFLSLICLTIFEKLLTIERYKDTRGIFEDEQGNKYVSLLLGLDEPEIHLHPYMQRSLIKYLIKIIENKDDGFSDLMSEIFSVNGFFGQIIICTHSPSILLSTYKQIIRLYRDEEDIFCVNGREIELSGIAEKHLMKNMPYVKEAFFSKCVILVEGDSELGAFPVFAEKLDIDLDDHGISVIQAGSGNSIPLLMELLDEFGIDNLGLMDWDKYEEKEDDYDEIDNLYYTGEQDFEQEIVSTCMKNDQAETLKNIVIEIDSMGENRTIQKNKLNQIVSKYDLDLDEFDSDLDFTEEDEDRLECLFLAWLDVNKSILLGRSIGEELPVELIPETFKQVLNKVVEVATDV
jgi:putative ATP-dependent endonuclease of OLD family